MSRKRFLLKDELVVSMNVVPYIDVMLVLLVIFMVTAPMFTPSVINLPSVSKASNINSTPIEISITNDQLYSIQQGSYTYSTKNLNDLLNKVKNMYTNHNAVIIAADKDIKYNNVVILLDKLHSIDIARIALAVNQK